MTRERSRRRARAALLLKLGSGSGVDGPRPGFEERVRARIAADDARRAGSVAAPSWADAFAQVARPALAAAAVVTMTTIAIHFWDLSRAAGDDLDRLVDADAGFAALLNGDAGDLLGDLPTEDAGPAGTP